MKGESGVNKAMNETNELLFSGSFTEITFLMLQGTAKHDETDYNDGMHCKYSKTNTWFICNI